MLSLDAHDDSASSAEMVVLGLAPPVLASPAICRGDLFWASSAQAAQRASLADLFASEEPERGADRLRHTIAGAEGLAKKATPTAASAPEAV